MTDAWERAKKHSEEKLTKLRNALKPFEQKNQVVMTFGSYARREASNESDIDYIVASSKPGDPIDLRNVINNIVPIDPASDGPFAKPTTYTEMRSNVGGSDDTNTTLTRRLLLLLEGEWLTNEKEFNKLRRDLLQKYVSATPKNHQLALFLLNDIIRYWRTMTVDYMYKTTEASKPWAIRNIKLIFSRKLMYASGLFSVALTVDKSEKAKVEILEELLSLPVIDRMIEICGKNDLENILRLYDIFLGKLERSDVRDILKTISNGDHEHEVFRELKNEGHNFTRELLLLFEKTFHSTHPIHRAVIF